jgi:hypothetical protein
MTRLVTVVVLALLTAGCIISDDREVRYYTRADIDAINAEMACRRLARNLLQVEQCGVRR